MKIRKILGATLVCVTLMTTVVMAANINRVGEYGTAFLNVDGRDGLYKVNTSTIRNNGTTHSYLKVKKTYYDGEETILDFGQKWGDSFYESGYEYIENYETTHKTSFDGVNHKFYTKLYY